MDFKKAVCMLLALLLLSAGVACSPKKDPVNPPESEKKTEGAGDVSDTETAEENYDPELAPINGGGKRVKFLSREAGVTANYWYSEISPKSEDDSNIVDSKLFARNEYLMDKYDVVIEMEEINYNQIATKIENQVRGNMDERDSVMVALPMLVHAFNMAGKGLCYSIEDLPFVDPEKPYWRNDIYHATTIKGKNYFISGDINTSVYGSSWTTFFNEVIVRSNEIENPYELVRSGEWTMEKALELAKGFGGDNGDGVFDNSDNYGICSGTWVWQCFLYGGCLKFVDKDAEDVPFFVMNDAGKSEQLKTVLSDIIRIMNDQSLSINANKAGLSAQPSKLFCDGQVLFYFANVNNAFVKSDIKDMSQEYGVLPLPKLNTDQKHYSNAVHPHHSSTVVVPLNISRETLTLVGSLLEDMAYESYQQVKPAYYETVITYQSVRNSESFSMMPYIFADFTIDFGLIMTDTFGFDAEIRNHILKNDSNFTSYFSSFLPLWNKALQDIVKSYGETS